VPGEEGILPVRCLIAAGVPAAIRGDIHWCRLASRSCVECDRQCGPEGWRTIGGHGPNSLPPVRNPVAGSSRPRRGVSCRIASTWFAYGACSIGMRM